MSYKIEFIKEAAKDYKKLDGSIKKLVNAKLDELSKNPLLGEKLGNKHTIDLTGFFKIWPEKIEEGKTISHEDVKKRLSKWLK